MKVAEDEFPHLRTESITNKAEWFSEDGFARGIAKEEFKPGKAS